MNLAKSLLVSVGTMDNVGDLFGILGCGTPSWPLKYLGLPLRACFKAKSIWNNIVEKIERRLAGWKMVYLSKGGNTLIKSKLSNLPTYFLSLFTILAYVANRIEKLQQDFFWGGMSLSIILSKVCPSIYDGGLGIQNLRVFN